MGGQVLARSRNPSSSSILRTLSAANKLAQRASGAMDTQDLLGLGSGDFEDVDFAASSESEGEEEITAGGSAKVVPRFNTTTSRNGAEISNVQNTPAAAAEAGPSQTAIGTTTILQVWSIWGCWRGRGGLCTVEFTGESIFIQAQMHPRLFTRI